jgi:hypothetical protein
MSSEALLSPEGSMTPDLRTTVSRIRELSPKLDAVADRASRVADEAARLIESIERLLGEECAFELPCQVPFGEPMVWPDGMRRHDYLAYTFYEGKFRIVVLDRFIIDGRLFDENFTEWEKCSREIRLSSFLAIPALLDAIANRAENVISQTDGAGRTIESLLDALGRKDRG